MIRIDVGDETARSGKTLGVKGGRIVLPKNLTGGRDLSIDILTGLLIVAAIIAALLPQPLVRQYKVMVTKRHQDTMASLKKQATHLESEISNLRPYKSELESYRKQQSLVKKRLGVVQNLLAARGTPVNVLDIVGQNLSRETWLDSMSFALVGNRSLELKGFAYSNEEISDYVDRLSESVYLTDVKLLNVRKQGDLGMRHFSLTANPLIEK